MKTFKQFISELSDKTLKSYVRKSKIDREQKMGWPLSASERKKLNKRKLSQSIAKKKLEK